MYKIREVEIKGFWGRMRAACKFNDNVNIIIGRNGTGKTTFMNILHSSLSVDLDGLVENDFNDVVIKLGFENRSKTIKVRKIDDIGLPFSVMEYQISQKKYRIRAFPNDDRRIFSHYRKRAYEEAMEVKAELARLVSLSSLSVYRLRGGEDFEIKDKSGKRIISPVDFRLGQLTSELTHYQFELSQKARSISSKLQKEVLASILYSGSKEESFLIPKNFDKTAERTKLTSAYTRLGVMDSDIRKKIVFHISNIDEAVDKFNSEKDNEIAEINFAALEAYIRTQRIMDLSLKAEEEINGIYSQINLFVAILKEFMPEKTFSLESGEIAVTNNREEEIPVDKLSSGEKQLLILLIETLLQRGEPYVYLTDEPELSLHIEWQSKILPAVKRINPHAQIIAATHSPEVASKYGNNLSDMKDVARG
ncbi:AAA family ATPase [Halomonas sp. A29]|uniref:AAA family ATPase n=1 Tax=Halomonas sp. A29 TaxID=3102786 RepID=UPI00398AFB2D